MRLSREHLDLLLNVAQDASLGGSFQERMQAITESLLSLVPGSAMTMIVLDPSRPQDGVDAFIHNADPAGAAEYAAHYVQYDPMPGLLLRAPEVPLRLSDSVSPSDWGKDPYTGSFLPRAQIRHILGFVGHLVDGRLLQVGIHREPMLSDFGERERHLLGLASHDLGQAAFSSLLREKLSRAQSVEEHTARVGLLVFNAKGYVEHADGGARGILSRLGTSFPMEDVLADSRAASALGQALQRSVRLDGDVLLMRSRPLERSATSSVLVVLEVRSPEPAQDFEDRVEPYGLTARERDVAKQAVLGLTNQQIGEELKISHITVAVHLTRIFRKVGVGGRIELTRRLTGSRPEQD